MSDVLEFTVIDTATNEYPDLWKIATTEEWAKHLMYCDMEGFAISEDGHLLLLDECGSVAYCPADRFKVVYTTDATPKSDVARIFEEIMDYLSHSDDDVIAECPYRTIDLDAVAAKFDDLKKKYTEGK